MEFRPKRGSKKCCDTRQKMCSFISFSQRFCLSLRFASRPHSSVDRAIRSRLQHQRSTKIKTPLGYSTVCKIFCGYSLIHFVYTKCGEKCENFICRRNYLYFCRTRKRLADPFAESATLPLLARCPDGRGRSGDNDGPRREILPTPSPSRDSRCSLRRPDLVL